MYSPVYSFVPQEEAKCREISPSDIALFSGGGGGGIWRKSITNFPTSFDVAGFELTCSAEAS